MNVGLTTPILAANRAAVANLFTEDRNHRTCRADHIAKTHRHKTGRVIPVQILDHQLGRSLGDLSHRRSALAQCRSPRGAMRARRLRLFQERIDQPQPQRSPRPDDASALEDAGGRRRLRGS